jgi:hypothetical protein
MTVPTLTFESLLKVRKGTVDVIDVPHSGSPW